MDDAALRLEAVRSAGAHGVGTRWRPIVWMSRDGTLQGDAMSQGSHLTPALAPDASRLAVVRVTPGEPRDIWIWDFARETMTRLTLDGGSTPVWSRDGRYLAFESVRDGARGISRIDVSGRGQAEILN